MLQIPKPSEHHHNASVETSPQPEHRRIINTVPNYLQTICIRYKKTCTNSTNVLYTYVQVFQNAQMSCTHICKYFKMQKVTKPAKLSPKYFSYTQHTYTKGLIYKLTQLKQLLQYKYFKQNTKIIKVLWRDGSAVEY